MKFNRGLMISLLCILFPVVLGLIQGDSAFIAVSTIVIAVGIVFIGEIRKKGWGDLFVCGLIYTVACIICLLLILLLMK